MGKPAGEVLRNNQNSVCVYEQACFQDALGDTLRPGGLALTQRALDLCAPPPAAKILDVGCGSGATVQYLRDRGFSALGVDLSFKLLRAGRMHLLIRPVLQADAVCLPLAAGGVDVVTAECSLSAFARADQALREFHRVLRGDGILILTDLYARNPSGLETLRARLPSSCLARSFVKESLLSILATVGFDLMAWEDHAEVIRSLAGESLSTLLTGSPECEMDSLDLLLSVASARPSYFLCILRKR